MAEEASNSMNLDLNLGPSPDVGSETMPSDTVNFVDWVAVDPIDRIVEAVRLRPRQRRRWRQVEYPHDQQTLSVELDQLISSSGNVDVLQSGEGSVAAGERAHEVPKTCENNNGFVKDEVSEKKGDVEKGSGEDGSFFDCNICFELATDPVVTTCGHLFCWPCLYRWLHAQEQEGRECPVCKGEVSTKNLTPIYGRGNSNQKPVDSSSLEIPVRPHARRVESLRQAIHRNLFSFPVEEVIRRLSSRFDLIEDLSASHDGANGAHATADRTSSLLQRNTVRSLPTPFTPPDDALDLTESGTTSYVRRQARRLQSLLIRRPQSHYHQSPSRTSFPPLFSTERLSVYSRRNSTSLSQEHPQPVDDRDSFSSIAAVINSESQLDTAMEIDSMVSLSTSSSRRRIDASRSSDVDSGDSPPRRRRRLN